VFAKNRLRTCSCRCSRHAIARDALTDVAKHALLSENQIEYCLGIELRDETLFAFVSQNDADPVVVEIPFCALDFMPFVQYRI
jgi:hypothetical protein